jgi:predicted DNA-binding ribbon-helix-helix protein
MRRTQLYIEDDLWKSLHLQARREKTTISDLVRRAVRERYSLSREKRREAMRAFVGIWSDREDLADAQQYVRNLRNDDRLDRLKEQ